MAGDLPRLFVRVIQAEWHQDVQRPKRAYVEITCEKETKFTLAQNPKVQEGKRQLLVQWDEQYVFGETNGCQVEGVREFFFLNLLLT